MCNDELFRLYEFFLCVTPCRFTFQCHNDSHYCVIYELLVNLLTHVCVCVCVFVTGTAWCLLRADSCMLFQRKAQFNVMPSLTRVKGFNVSKSVSKATPFL